MIMINITAKNPDEFFKALGDKNRLKIISLLYKNGPMGTKKISELLNLSASAISQHLKILKHIGLVSKDKSGYWVSYRVNQNAMSHCHCMLTRVCHCGCLEEKEEDYTDLPMDILLLYKQWLECELDKIKTIIKKNNNK